MAALLAMIITMRLVAAVTSRVEGTVAVVGKLLIG